MLKMEKYTIKARYFPSIITAIPYTIIWHYLISNEIIDYFNFINSISWISDISFLVVVTYFLSQINRIVGKFVFEKWYFKKDKDLPTTIALTCNSWIISRETFSKLEKTVKNDFDLSLPNEQELNDDEKNSKLRIIEIVGQIRNKVKDWRLLLQHNIEYWFWRNLIWGIPIMILIWWVWLYFLSTKWIGWWFWIMLIILSLWLVILILSKFILNKLGKQYAEVLIQEYLWK